MKTLIGRVCPLCVGPASLISSICDDGTVDFTSITEAGIVSNEPAMIFIALNKTHVATHNISVQKKFGFNVPCAAIIDKADYVANVPVQGTIKQTIFETVRYDLDVPLIKECQLSAVCVVERFIEDLPGPNSLIIASVMNTYCDKAYIGPTGLPDVQTINPLIVALQDNRYFAIGPYLGTRVLASQQITERQEIERSRLEQSDVERQK